MRVIYSPIFSDKLKSVAADEQKTVRSVLARLRADGAGVGETLPGLENTYRLRTGQGGPVVLYEVSGQVATVKGLITSRQQELGKFDRIKPDARARGRTVAARSKRRKSSSKEHSPESRVSHIA
ncbi:hypothetical protein [Roseateles chitinivorans]|uniref:hypothetical protein n=1 Tax=Roseateles chitinivorans TaxID=2917965 RepID=UPI003D67911A